MKIILILTATMALLALAIIMLGVKVLFVKGGKFPSPHIHHNAPLKEKGITCAHSDTE